MTGPERSDLALLSTRLLGIDGGGEGEHGGVLGRFDVRLAAVEKRLDRWDGAIMLVRAGASLLGLGGIAIILRAVLAP